MTISILLQDVQKLDTLAWVQLLGLSTLIVFAARVYYWLYRSSIKNGDVAKTAEQVLITTETAASFHHDFHPSAAHVAIAEAKALPRIHEGLTS